MLTEEKVPQSFIFLNKKQMISVMGNLIMMSSTELKLFWHFGLIKSKMFSQIKKLTKIKKKQVLLMKLNIGEKEKPICLILINNLNQIIS
jgi:hypothetical protein